MSRLFWSLSFGFVLTVPSITLAVQIQTYDLSAGHINARWEGSGPIEMQKSPSGIFLKTLAGTGIFFTTTAPAFSPEAVTITLSAREGASPSFGWTLKDHPLKSTFGIPFTVRGIPTEHVSLPLSKHEQWNGDPETMGLILPPNTSLILHTLEFYYWSPLDRLKEMLAAFWTFDTYRPYSINFLWGPLLAFNGFERVDLYQVLPPPQVSATFALYGLVIFSLLGLAGFAKWRVPVGTRKSWVSKRGIILVFCAWLLMDFRMGMEFLSWVRQDYRTYMNASGSERVFRERDRFYDFAAFVRPLVADRPTYVFFGEQEWPYLGNMRYLTYPSIPGIDYTEDDTWVIYRRPDMVVNAAGQMTIDGEAVSNPGNILGKFDDSSYVFRTFPLNSQ